MAQCPHHLGETHLGSFGEDEGQHAPIPGSTIKCNRPGASFNPLGGSSSVTKELYFAGTSPNLAAAYRPDEMCSKIGLHGLGGCTVPRDQGADEETSEHRRPWGNVLFDFHQLPEGEGYTFILGPKISRPGVLDRNCSHGITVRYMSQSIRHCGEILN